MSIATHHCCQCGLSPPLGIRSWLAISRGKRPRLPPAGDGSFYSRGIPSVIARTRQFCEFRKAPITLPGAPVCPQKVHGCGYRFLFNLVPYPTIFVTSVMVSYWHQTILQLLQGFHIGIRLFCRFWKLPAHTSTPVLVIPWQTNTM